jgi:FkbM family methyltransferase
MIDQEVIDDQDYDSHLCAALVTHSNFTGGIILDIGGSLGYFCHNILKYYPESRVVSIEPCISNFEFLTKNVKDLNVIPIHGAVTNGQDKIMFYENYNPNQGVIFMSNYIEHWKETISDSYIVQGYDFRKILNVFRPNLIKIDIEGYEYFLDYSDLPNSVNTIIMEVHMTDIEGDNTEVLNAIDNDLEVYSEITHTLKSQGFEYIKPPEVNFPWDGTWDGSNRTHIVCLTRLRRG